jgi:RNA polymerase sigma-70 factor (ECF subfamily)
VNDVAWGDDARLVLATAGGDDAAFSRHYRRYLPLVLSWCVRETGDRELAADLAAEVFAASLTASHRYRPEDGSVAAWLVGIARNKLRESRRRGRIDSRARRRLGVQPVVLTDADLERVDEIAGLESQIDDVLAGLPAAQREALVAHVVAERSYEEIARELRCSESVVRQRVSRGLRTLRSQLEEQ